MKYTALKDEAIFSLMLQIKGVKDASIIRFMLFKKAFDKGSAVSTSAVCDFCSMDPRACLRFLNRLLENNLIACHAKGREKFWYLLGAAAISRVMLNPDFYSGKNDANSEKL